MKKFFVGIDFSKRKMDVSIVEKDSPEQAIAYKQFANNAEGAKEMCNWVERTTGSSTKHDGEVLFCGEHTGSYCLEVCDYLSENGKYIWLGNPLDIKRSTGQAKRHPGYAKQKHNIHALKGQKRKNIKALGMRNKTQYPRFCPFRA